LADLSRVEVECTEDLHNQDKHENFDQRRRKILLYISSTYSQKHTEHYECEAYKPEEVVQ